MADSVENPSALKHHYGPALLARIADSFDGVHPRFDRERFLGLMPELKTLEMKPRVRRLRDELRRQLPEDYPKALRLLLKSAASGKLGGFDLWPYTEFVQAYGLEHVDLSLDALKEMTPLFTSEWAVRPFLRMHPKKTLAYLDRCARDKDEHVRRWASEGSRPRLPWGERLHDFVKDPSPLFPILERLRFDEALYVRKSVCNHLNDIAKDHPALVVKVLAGWQRDAGDKHADKIDWIIHRSLRTLIKTGHPGALKLIGVTGKPQVELGGFRLSPKRIRLGESLEFALELRSLSSKPQKLVVDYVMHFVKANGKTAPKVFKWRTFELPARGTVTLSKAHAVRRITTRRYYAGKGALEVQINGASAGKLEWTLAL